MIGHTNIHTLLTPFDGVFFPRHQKHLFFFSPYTIISRRARAPYAHSCYHFSTLSQIQTQNRQHPFGCRELNLFVVSFSCYNFSLFRFFVVVVYLLAMLVDTHICMSHHQHTEYVWHVSTFLGCEMGARICD